MAFNEKIKERREQLGFTQTEVADYLHVTRQTISKWKLGKSYPDLDLLVSLSDFYDLSLDELLKEDQRIIKFIQADVHDTWNQKLMNSLTSVAFWIFFLVLLINSWTDQSFEEIPMLQLIILIIATISNGSIFILSLIQLFQTLFHKEKKHIQEKKKSMPSYSLNNLKNIFSTIGLVLLMISLVFKR